MPVTLHRRASMIGWFFLLLVGCVGNGHQAESETPTIVLAVQDLGDHQTFILEPIALILPSGIVPAPNSWCSEFEKEAPQFESRYLKQGTKQKVLFGGADAGTLTVVGYEPGRGFIVNLEQRGQLGGLVMALATNSQALGRQKGSRRPPTTLEESVATELARQGFLARGISAASLGRVTLSQLTATDLEGDKQPELVGSAIIEREDGLGVEHSLFFVAKAKQDSKSYAPTVIWYDSAPTALDGKLSLLVDHVDMDGDGVDELVTKVHFWERWQYRIYKKGRDTGTWNEVTRTPICGQP